MIITCEECTTRFKLDDARIPAKGTKVRCSKCKHAFFVKPEASAGDPVDSAVSKALAEDDVQTKELSGPEDSASGLRAPDTQSAQEAIDEFEESDWEFNTEGPGPERTAQDSFDKGAALDFGADAHTAPELGGASGLDPEGLDSEADTQPNAGPDLLADPPSDAAGEVVDGLLGGAGEVVDGLLGGAGDEEEELFDTQPGAVERSIDALLDDGPGTGSGLDLDSGPPGSGPAHDPVESALDELGLAGGSEPPPAPPEPDVAVPASREELGEPGEWDFFGEADAKPERAPMTTAPLVIGRIGVSANEVRPPVEVDPEPTAFGVWGRRLVHAAGWATVSALVALVLYQALWLAPQVGPPVPTSQQVAGLEASSIEGRWVERLGGEFVYVVSGELRSIDGVRTPGARLTVRLVDGTGLVLVDEAAEVGAVLPDPRLREAPAADLLAAQSAAAQALAWQPFYPGRNIPFAAVLAEVPAEAHRFELTAIPAARPAAGP